MKGSVSVISLILITMLAAFSVLFYYIWASKTQGTMTEAFGEAHRRTVTLEKSCLALVSSTENSVTLKNCGKVDLENIRVYANGLPAGEYRGVIEPGKTVTVPVNLGYGMNDIEAFSGGALAKGRIYVSFPPEIRILKPTGTYLLSPVPVEVNVSDDRTPADSVAVEAWVNGSSVSLTYDSGSGLWVGWVTVTSEGTYNFTVKAADSEGKSSVASSTFVYSLEKLVGWKYRKRMDVFFPGQIMTVSINWFEDLTWPGADPRNGCRDFRFTDENSTPLPYYLIECNLYWFVAVVNVSSIPEINKTLYIYWGNPSATDQSNPYLKRFFLEDFDALDTSLWREDKGPGVTSEVRNSELVVSVPSYQSFYQLSSLKPLCYGMCVVGVTVTNNTLPFSGEGDNGHAERLEILTGTSNAGGYELHEGNGAGYCHLVQPFSDTLLTGTLSGPFHPGSRPVTAFVYDNSEGDRKSNPLMPFLTLEGKTVGCGKYSTVLAAADRNYSSPYYVVLRIDRFRSWVGATGNITVDKIEFYSLPINTTFGAPEVVG